MACIESRPPCIATISRVIAWLHWVRSSMRNGTSARTRTHRVFGSHSPFGRSTRVATAGDHFFLARQSTYQIERYTSEGKLDRLVRRSFTPRRVNRGHIDAFKRKRLASPGEPRRSIDARLLAEVPFPETFPPHGQIRVDSEGYIWVQDDPIPGAVRNRSGPCSRPRGACSARCASHET